MAHRLRRPCVQPPGAAPRSVLRLRAVFTPVSTNRCCRRRSGLLHVAVMLARKISFGSAAVAALGLASLIAAAAPGAGIAGSPGRVGPTLRMTANGRHLTPAGRLTEVGNFPTGGA